MLENNSDADTHEAQQNDGLKATINVDTTEATKAIKQMQSAIDDIRLREHTLMPSPDADHESYYDIRYDDMFIRQFKRKKQSQKDFVKEYVETVNQFIYNSDNDTGQMSKLYFSNSLHQARFFFDAHEYSYQLPNILCSLGNKIGEIKGNNEVQAIVFYTNNFENKN
ncbi:hypothetical protein [Ligilactobacillus acidipiscis]|uniref:hypothetical protein n=1 Tax=Ligilactobacillus acidipiscis TaxID=89059 RepID=UPI0022E13910|nr:hypothetical protein [Ligilactobacillus acidipiscis]